MSYVIDFETVSNSILQVVTPEQVMARARLPTDEDSQDIAEMILEATDWLESRLRRSFTTKTLKAVLALEPPVEGKIAGTVGWVVYPLDLPQATRLQSVTSVEIETNVETWATLDEVAGEYKTDLDSRRGRIFLSVAAWSKWAPQISYPMPQEEMPRFRVTYVAGATTPDDVPAEIRGALLRIVTWMYDNRDMPIPENMAPKTKKVYIL